MSVLTDMGGFPQSGLPLGLFPNPLRSRGTFARRGMSLVCDPAAPDLWTPSNTGIDLRYGYCESDNFQFGVNNTGNKTIIAIGAANASAAMFTSTSALQTGVVRMVTTLVDYVSLFGAFKGSAVPYFLPGDGWFECAWWFQMDTTLSNSSDRYIINLGMASDSTSAPGDEIILNYNDSASANFRLVTRVGAGTPAVVVGSTVVTASTRYRVRFLWSVANSVVYMFIKPFGGAETLDAVYSGTTLPAATTPMAPVALLNRTVTGSVFNRFLYVDGWQIAANYATQQ
jgi:hypothetical protein